MKKVLFFLFLIFSASVHAQFPERPKTVIYLNDFSGILPAAEVEILEKKLREIHNLNPKKFQVVTVMIADLDGAELNEYANGLANKWGIGHKGKDNGVLVLIAFNQKSVRIEVGARIEDKIPDAAAADIIDNIIVPAFRQRQYMYGIEASMIKIMELLGAKFPEYYLTDVQTENTKDSVQQEIVQNNTAKTDDAEFVYSETNEMEKDIPVSDKKEYHYSADFSHLSGVILWVLISVIAIGLILLIIYLVKSVRKTEGSFFVFTPETQKTYTSVTQEHYRFSHIDSQKLGNSEQYSDSVNEDSDDDKSSDTLSGIGYSFGNSYSDSVRHSDNSGFSNDKHSYSDFSGGTFGGGSFGGGGASGKW